MNKKYKIISIFLSALIFVFAFFPVKSYASEYWSNLTKEEQEKVLALKVTDVVDNAWSWLGDAQSYTVVQVNDDGTTIPWWNVPNAQLLAQNIVYHTVTQSGYGNGVGVSAKKGSPNSTFPDKPLTAQQALGYQIPSPTYLGERPYIYFDIAGVMMPDNPADATVKFAKQFDGMDLTKIGEAFLNSRKERPWWDIPGNIYDTIKAVFPNMGNMVPEAPSNTDYSTLFYMSPYDYSTSGLSAMTFEDWVKTNWNTVMKAIKPNQIVMSDTDENGLADGAYWLKDTLLMQNSIDGTPLADCNGETQYKEICAKLKDLCGYRYANVCFTLVRLGVDKAGIKPLEGITQRIMPYDLSTLTDKDKNMIGIADPRTEMQMNTVNTGIANALPNFVAANIVNNVGRVAELCVNLNKVATFDFIEDIGINPMLLWAKPIVEIAGIIISISLVLLCLKTAFQVIKTGDVLKAAAKTAVGIFIGIVVILFIQNPDLTYKTVKDTYNSVIGISNVALENNETINELYGNGSPSDKENCGLWLPYFNMWTYYNTNHQLLDDSNVIDRSSSVPEIKGMKEYDIADKKVNIWSYTLASSFTTDNASYDRDAYRVVDHFMAPRVDIKASNGTVNSLNVTQNENYNGNIQSSIDFGSALFQYFLLIIVVIKDILFFEMIFDLTMLIVNVALSVTDSGNLAKNFKKLLADILNLVIINTVMTLSVWSALNTNTAGALALIVLYSMILISSFKELVASGSIFAPMSLKYVVNYFNKLKSKVVSTANRLKGGVSVG